ncbi:MAG: SulP family inorganic anion transporter [Egibacteraceae bacterium]
MSTRAETGQARRTDSSLRSRAEAILRHDVPASLVVFLIAVPLSLGIAVASGAPLMAGLIAAAVGGVVVGALGGSALQVSGPAAGLTVVVAELVATYGWKTTGAITVAAGAVQLVLGMSRFARAALAISPAVVHGMLAGIGITIVLSQLHVVLGGAPNSGALDNLRQLPSQVVSAHGPDVVAGLLVVALMLAWPRLPARLSRVPAPLVAVGLVTVAVTALGLGAERVELPSSFIDSLALPALPRGDWGGLILAVLTVALIASVESLLSAVAIDKMHSGRRADLDRELTGQGVANMASGLLGGLPVTGVIVRSSANVSAGARTRASAVLHGLWVVVFSVLLGGLVERIPLAALAGLLVVVGMRLVDIAHLRSLHRHGELPVYLTTVVGVVVLNLLEGVLIGLALGLALMLRRMLWSTVHAEELGAGRWRVVVEGRLSFLSVPRLSRVLGRIPAGSDVVVELVVDYLDHAAYEHLHAWQDRHRAGGGAVVVDEVGSQGLRDRGTAEERRSRRARETHRHLPRWFSPWARWQEASGDHTGGDGGLAPVLAGLSEYHRRSAPLVAPMLAEMVDRPHASSLFLTCGDSRVIPNVLTSSGPGDLFTVRNIGNLVPRHDSARASGDTPSAPDLPDVSVAAALEYAIKVLEVRAILVCGHSGCQAMQALLAQADAQDGSLGRWLQTARPSLRRWGDGDPVAVAAATDGRDELDQLVMVNIVQQLDNLRTHPIVDAALRQGQLDIAGLYFDIATARMLLFDPSSHRFVPAPEHSRDLPFSLQPTAHPTKKTR